jgi:hypothetical protein
MKIKDIPFLERAAGNSPPRHHKGNIFPRRNSQDYFLERRRRNLLQRRHLPESRKQGTENHQVP